MMRAPAVEGGDAGTSSTRPGRPKPLDSKVKHHAGALSFSSCGTISMPLPLKLVRMFWARLSEWKPSEVGEAAYALRSISAEMVLRHDSSAPAFFAIGSRLSVAVADRSIGVLAVLLISTRYE